MLKRVLVIGLLGFWVIGLAGCATARKQREAQMQELKNQVSTLESQVQSKDEEINDLKTALANAPQAAAPCIEKKSKKRIILSVKSRPNARHIQIALSNAGYNPGRIDGKMGKQTVEAIKEFQRANNLAVTGKADKKTWNALRGYLYKKLK